MGPIGQHLHNGLQDQPKLKPAFKKRWLEALRSGGYKKGQKRLHNVAGCFCCLGVAADIEVDAFWVLDFFERTYSLDRGVGYAERTTLPTDVREAIGLSEDAEAALMGGNDDGLTFEQIANAIEKCL